MKFSVGLAKNEPIELVLGNILIGFGGFLLGVALLNLELIILSSPAVGLFTMGIILDVRVLKRFSQELQNTKKRIEEVKKEAHEDSIKNALIFG